MFTNLILVYCTLQSSADLWVCIAYSIASDIYLHVTVCTKPLVTPLALVLFILSVTTDGTAVPYDRQIA